MMRRVRRDLQGFKALWRDGLEMILYPLHQKTVYYSFTSLVIGTALLIAMLLVVEGIVASLGGSDSVAEACALGGYVALQPAVWGAARRRPPRREWSRC